MCGFWRGQSLEEAIHLTVFREHRLLCCGKCALRPLGCWARFGVCQAFPQKETQTKVRPAVVCCEIASAPVVFCVATLALVRMVSWEPKNAVVPVVVCVFFLPLAFSPSLLLSFSPSLLRSFAPSLLLSLSFSLRIDVFLGRDKTLLARWTGPSGVRKVSSEKRRGIKQFMGVGIKIGPTKTRSFLSIRPKNPGFHVGGLKKKKNTPCWGYPFFLTHCHMMNEGFAFPQLLLFAFFSSSCLWNCPSTSHEVQASHGRQAKPAILTEVT